MITLWIQIRFPLTSLGHVDFPDSSRDVPSYDKLKKETRLSAMIEAAVNMINNKADVSIPANRRRDALTNLREPSVKYHRHFAKYSAMHRGKIRGLIGATSANS